MGIIGDKYRGSLLIIKIGKNNVIKIKKKFKFDFEVFTIFLKKTREKKLAMNKKKIIKYCQYSENKGCIFSRRLDMDKCIVPLAAILEGIN